MEMAIMCNGLGHTAYFDDEDANLIMRYKWHLARGYARTTIYNNRKSFSISMHELVFPLLKKTSERHHIDGNALNNRKENLIEVDSRTHFKMHGGKIKNNRVLGSRNGSAKLTEQQVIEIRKLYNTGKYSGRELARMYRMKSTPMQYLLNRKTWKHI